jgi:Tfp pilus assembly protein PilN
MARFLRTNLATRPFYNETAVRFWLAVLAAAVVAATIFNVTQWIRYSRSDTELAQRASRDEARAAELRSGATKLRTSVDGTQVQAIAADAGMANSLIDRRTFSWTELFNRFEATIPGNLRITSVRQRIDRVRGPVLTITVVAQSVKDINQFMESLEQSGAFTQLLAQDETLNEQDEVEGTLEALYRPAAGTAAPAAPEAAPTTGVRP